MKAEIKTVLSEGTAYGPVRIFRNDNVKNAQDAMTAFNAKNEDVNRFLDSLRKSKEQLDQMIDENPVLSEYLMFSVLSMSDSNLINDIVNKITKGLSPENAVAEAVDRYSENLRNSPSSYFRERVSDLEDVKYRLIRNLSSREITHPDEKFIVYAEEFYPSSLISAKEKIIGIIARTGGMTSHTAIIARSMGIPYVLTDAVFEEGMKVYLCTKENVLLTNPEEENLPTKQEEKNVVLVPHEGYSFYANATGEEDAKNALKRGFDGIGLFRTEMVFMDSTRPLSLPEQYEIYNGARKLFSHFVFRTFDITADKKIDYLNCNDNTMANYMRNHQVFKNQIKAILACFRHGRARIMFPMIRDPGEFRYLKEWVVRIATELSVNVPYIGMMLETKEAFLHLPDYDPDFISVGTNDLTAELYGIKREEMTSVSDEIIADLAGKLGSVNAECKKRGIPLTVCGELAGTKKGALALLKAGITSLSVAPSSSVNLNEAFCEYIKSVKQ